VSSFKFQVDTVDNAAASPLKARSHPVRDDAVVRFSAAAGNKIRGFFRKNSCNFRKTVYNYECMELQRCNN
ncbi:MAG: hypothetical protein IJS14_13670, partial [Lentisphaeria bacterium]|nr:hypothetical protein [Lentisphaeria bacterium]